MYLEKRNHATKQNAYTFTKWYSKRCLKKGEQYVIKYQKRKL